jgi:hypothetical protein
MTEFDVFISHASEDKDGFVRALARALEDRHLHPWYDEFTLRPGDSLRRSIDHGLLTSQAGIIVLSQAFFSKRWTAYELDGLVQLNAGGSNQIARGGQTGSRLIPVWYGVGSDDVARFSPSLANLIALNSSKGVDAVADGIRDALRPTGSTLLFAHAELTELGEPHNWYPPTVTDDWWLDVAGASTKGDVEGTFLEPVGWGRWGFPLPEQGNRPQERGHRIARAAAQMMWQKKASDIPISQLTPPTDVLAFIGTSPGLAEACVQFPSHLLSYAPQLALPGMAGWLEPTVKGEYSRVKERYAEPDSHESRRKIVNRAGYVALRDVHLVRADRIGAARAWLQGEIHGSPVQVYEVLDYAAWLVSESSHWMGTTMRPELLTGILEWYVWPQIGKRNWSKEGRDAKKGLGIEKARGIEILASLEPANTSSIRRVWLDLTTEIRETVEKLGLQDDPRTLAEHLIYAALRTGV